MKKFIIVNLMVILLLLTGCQSKQESNIDKGKNPKMEKYEMTFFDTFDTVTNIILYAETQEQAQKYGEEVHQRFLELHKIYDKYNSYEGINNIYSINKKAGQGPIEVSEDLINLLDFSIQKYKKYGTTNIGIGSVTKIWSKYRDGHEEGADFELAEKTQEKSPTLPNINELKKANEHTNIDNILIDRDKKTVEIKDPEMRIDVGAVAKGYATELIAQELMDKGLTSALISAGGNVRIIGGPPEIDRDYFGVGLQNPEAIYPPNASSEAMKDVLYVNDTSVVTSGDYQRFYIVEGKPYHHLIDPQTLMPANHFRSVSIVAKDSGLCDYLSTAAFCLSYEDSKKLIESIDGVEAYWIHMDGSVTYTDGLKDRLKSQGATNRE